MLLRGLTALVLFQLLGTLLNVLWLSFLPGPIIGLVLLFMRAVVLKDMLNIITIGFGFILQAGCMALILFK